MLRAQAITALIFAVLASVVAGQTTHTWYFEVNEFMGNPDGTYDRMIYGFNNTWPLPTLRVTTGDRVQVYLTNGLEAQNTTLHFHGLFQNGTSQMDGPEMITQCPIAPGDTMLYNFTVTDQVGTYWYHSHTAGQYGDGMRGIFIIEPESTSDYPFDFDEEVVLPIGEWYHETSLQLMPLFLNLYNPTGAEPIPQNTLFNDTRNNSWAVEPNTTYFVRIVNVGGFVSQYLYMEDHEFTVVEVDGIWVQPNTTEMLYITVAQRYGVLITTKSDATKNYAFMNKIDDDMLDVIPDDLILNSTNSIQYSSDYDYPEEYTVEALDFLDDFYLEPVEKVALLDDPDYTVTVDVVMNNLDNGINYAFFNNVTYTPAKVPVIGTAMSTGGNATSNYIYGNVHAFVLQKDDVVDIVLNNQDTGKHPFHLHGHVFQVIDRGSPVDDSDPPEAFDYDNHTAFPEYPMRRDVVYVNPQSHIVMRFKADNPGVWFFHCHIEWHLEQGLALVFIEAPEEMQAQESQQFTDNWKSVCENSGVSISGNAAGNTVDVFDLSGANVQVKALPAGFTAKGIVALVFSAIAGFLGLAAIAFYGMSEAKIDLDAEVIRDLDVTLSEEDEVELVREAASVEIAQK